MTAGKHRNIQARKDLEDWLKRVGLPYHSPHKFRHGNAVYALKNAKDVSALKAVSQNLMHKNLRVIDGVYGILSDLDVKEQMAMLGTNLAGNLNKQELVLMLKKLLDEL
jgi:site-specific recombinase XerC